MSDAMHTDLEVAAVALINYLMLDTAAFAHDAALAHRPFLTELVNRVGAAIGAEQIAPVK